MKPKKSASSGTGLVRSCENPSGDWVRTLTPGDGIELLQARFAGVAYDRHRHDTYAIGLTDDGVQNFTYRGASESSTAGKVLVLHPDEPHDGHAGCDDGFSYRMLYVAPVRLTDALRSLGKGPASLPFVADAVSTNRTLGEAIETAFDEEDALAGEPLALDGLFLQVAEGLSAGDPSRPRPAKPRRLDTAALERARQRLHDESTRVVHSSELEALTGLSRFELARQFRALYGTSPYRYLQMRRLDKTRAALAGRDSLAEIALDAGFADQAHFTRSFRAAYGTTPARYRNLQKVGSDPIYS